MRRQGGTLHKSKQLLRLQGGRRGERGFSDDSTLVTPKTLDKTVEEEERHGDTKPRNKGCNQLSPQCMAARVEASSSPYIINREIVPLPSKAPSKAS